MSQVPTPVLRKEKNEKTLDFSRYSEVLSEFEIVGNGALLDPGFKSDRPEETENPLLHPSHPFITIASIYFMVSLAVYTWNFFHLVVMIRYAILCKHNFPEWHSYDVWMKIFKYNIIFDIFCTITTGFQNLAFGYLVFKMTKLRRQELSSFISLLVANLVALIVKYLILFLYGSNMSFVINRVINDSYGFNYLFLPDFSISFGIMRGVLEFSIWSVWCYFGFQMHEMLGVNRLMFQ
jgi:hypothetical protein